MSARTGRDEHAGTFAHEQVIGIVRRHDDAETPIARELFGQSHKRDLVAKVQGHASRDDIDVEVLEHALRTIADQSIAHAHHVRPQGAYLCADFFGSYGELSGFYAAFREMAADAQYRVSEPLYQIAAGPVFGSGEPFPMRLSAKLESAG